MMKKSIIWFALVCFNETRDENRSKKKASQKKKKKKRNINQIFKLDESDKKNVHWQLHLGLVKPFLNPSKILGKGLELRIT